jgi:hypothetical protein
MTSPRKAEANRRNAQKSTGPKTPEGKAAVRLNRRSRRVWGMAKMTVSATRLRDQIIALVSVPP